jgi:hypothetical protein
MATTKNSTKAKTKKPVRKTSSKTTVKAAKTAKKSLSTKVTKPTAKKLTSALLTKLNILSAVVSVALAAAAWSVMSSKSFEIVNGLLAKDELASKTGDVLVPAVHHVYDVELRLLVIIVLVISAILPTLWLTVYKSRYAEALKSKVNLLRWIDMAVISALMVEIVALVSGVQDIVVLKLLAGLMVVTCVLGWIAEKRNKQAGRPVWSELAVSIATGVLPWLLIATYAVSTWVHGGVHNSNYVYALYGVVFVGFVAYSMNLVNYVRRFGAWTKYEVVERNYLVVSIFTKVAFAAALIAGFQK